MSVLLEHFVLRQQHPLRIVPLDTFPGILQTWPHCSIQKCHPDSCNPNLCLNRVGDISCTPCPIGMACPNASVPPYRCPLGTFSVGERSMRKCAAFYHYHHLHHHPTAVLAPSTTSRTPLSQSSESESSQVEEHAHLNHTSIPVATGRQDSCTTCPAGFACSSISCGLCPDDLVGTSSDLTANDQACNGTIERECWSRCDNGTYALEGQASCTSCAPGWHPATHCFSHHPINIKITAQSWGDGRNITQQTRWTHTRCSHSKSITGRKCTDGAWTGIPCEDGRYSLGGQAECTPCPAGWQCADKTVPPTICREGSYSPAGSMFCVDCPSGAKCPVAGLSYPQPCSPGSYSAANATSCSPCPAGFKCPSPAEDPIACQAGYWAHQNSSICRPCEAGFRCPQTDAFIQIACEPGTYSFAAQSSCSACARGYECPTGTDGGSPCPLGHFSVGMYSFAEFQPQLFFSPMQFFRPHKQPLRHRDQWTFGPCSSLLMFCLMRSRSDHGFLLLGPQGASMHAFFALRDFNVKTRPANLYPVPTASGVRRAKSIVQSVLQHTNARVLTCLHHNAPSATGAMGGADIAVLVRTDTTAGDDKTNCCFVSSSVSPESLNPGTDFLQQTPRRPKISVLLEGIVRLHLALFPALLAPGAIQLAQHLKPSASSVQLVTTVYSRLFRSTITFVPGAIFARPEHHTGFNFHAQADTTTTSRAPSRKTHAHFVFRVTFVPKEVPPSGHYVQLGMFVGLDLVSQRSAMQGRGLTSRDWSPWNSVRLAHQEAIAWREAATPRLVRRGPTQTYKVPCRGRSALHVMQAGRALRLG